jgi:hypothetical protein
MTATGNGDLEMIQTLLARKVNINALSPKGMTALVIAKARAGQGPAEGARLRLATAEGEQKTADGNGDDEEGRGLDGELLIANYAANSVPNEIVDLLKENGALEKKPLRIAKIKWDEEERIRAAAPKEVLNMDLNRPMSSGERRKVQGKIRIL